MHDCPFPAFALIVQDARFPADQGFTMRESINAQGYWNVRWDQPGCCTEDQPGPKFQDWDITADTAELAAARVQAGLQWFDWPLPAAVEVSRHYRTSTIGGRVLDVAVRIPLPLAIHLPLESVTTNPLLD